MTGADTGKARTLAVIPARGGSKRIPRKNLRHFVGRPMIAWAIEGARASGLFERIVVSTDDAEIAAIARAHGAEIPFMRPADQADDHSPTVPVVAHAVRSLQAMGWVPGPVCCIYPAVPLLQAADLKRGLALLLAGAPGYVFPVAAYPSPVQRALLRDADGASRPMQPQHALTRTQDLSPAFFDAGQFYWATAQTWCEGQAIHAHAHTLELPAWRVVDIDTPDDWQRADLLCRALGLAGMPVPA